MPASQDLQPASATISQEGERLCIILTGDWRLTAPLPHWAPPAKTAQTKHIAFDCSELSNWDSSLLLYLHSVQNWCDSTHAELDTQALPPRLLELLTQLENSHKASKPKDRSTSILESIGLQATTIWHHALQISNFVGELSLSASRLLKKPGSFRWRDCVGEMQQCGVMALPIVSLISFLVGITLAYTGATILRLFGGDIWVADLIGLSVTREMAAVMTGVVLAGRTGAAFAAQLGNMKANEEIDALQTLGVSPTDFLVMPRIVALAIMTPLLALYGVLLGILGGMLIAQTILSIPPTAYWVEMLTIVDLSDVSTGLLKASAFGVIIGMSGCLRGLQADRSAEGVGKAATSAVVTAILLMVLADAFFAVLFNILGW